MRPGYKKGENKRVSPFRPPSITIPATKGNFTRYRPLIVRASSSGGGRGPSTASFSRALLKKKAGVAILGLGIRRRAGGGGTGGALAHPEGLHDGEAGEDGPSSR